MDTKLTRDADFAICQLYAEYLRRWKNGASKCDAAEFNSDVLAESGVFPTWSESDIDDALDELKDANFLKMDIIGNFELTKNAIVYMENRFKGKVMDVIDIISKLKP